MYTCIYNQYLLIEFVRLVDILQTEFELSISNSCLEDSDPT